MTFLSMYLLVDVFGDAHEIFVGHMCLRCAGRRRMRIRRKYNAYSPEHRCYFYGLENRMKWRIVGADSDMTNHYDPQHRMPAVLEPEEAMYLLRKWNRGQLMTQFAALRNALTDLDVKEIDLAAGRLLPWQQARVVDQLVAAGASIDPNELYESVDFDERVMDIDRFVAAGAKVDVNELYSSLPPLQRALALRRFLAAGLQLTDETTSELRTLSAEFDWCLLEAYPELRAAGFEIDLPSMVRRLTAREIVYYLDIIRGAGISVDVRSMIEDFDDFQLAGMAAQIHRADVTLDITGLIRRLARDFGRYLSRAAAGLLEAGALTTELASTLDPEGIAANLLELLAAGADIDVDALVESLPPKLVREHYLVLRSVGADLSLLRTKAGLHTQRHSRTTPATRMISAASIRAWLRTQGYPVPSRGRIPSALVAEYDKRAR
ncbi:histone-like nucleoid-structuring protein Lsr2 [Microbacterium sp.]|uniref:Lsr2 family DNA-binding protein n=1 Tax=Microbacterium sp. TaxID=51671 RepID=UPI001AC3BBC7|nr:histone-like nucleoid-structuring protein Lsr2 [Microbacterium sp.]MBN9156902.1 Lsr2 family protein [Microbacterium sp.]